MWITMVGAAASFVGGVLLACARDMGDAEGSLVGGPPQPGLQWNGHELQPGQVAVDVRSQPGGVYHAPNSAEVRLQALKKMLDQGLIGQADFEQKKQAILAAL